jgi:hypothetical protein
MFETSMQEELGMRWRILSTCVAFILLLVMGYTLIA